MPVQEYEIVTGIIVAIIVFLLGGFFILVLVAYMNQRKKKHIEEKMNMQTSFQQELLRTQLEIQEQTFKNISEEIHDNIGQVLSLAKLHLATMDASHDLVLQQKIKDSKELVAKAIQDLRHLSHGLNTSYVSEMGFARALEYELEFIRKSGLYETSFSMEGTLDKMDPEKELILFRMVQELLNNIIKHARAKRIALVLNNQLGSLIITITDDGEGFDLTAVRENSTFGLGLKSMNNRAGLIGAAFSLSSTRGKGTMATIHLPDTVQKTT